VTAAKTGDFFEQFGFAGTEDISRRNFSTA
jgi:hypothetical protein